MAAIMAGGSILSSLYVNFDVPSPLSDWCCGICTLPLIGALSYSSSFDKLFDKVTMAIVWIDNSTCQNDIYVGNTMV